MTLRPVRFATLPIFFTITACMNASQPSTPETLAPPDPMSAIAVEKQPAIEPTRNPDPERLYVLTVAFDEIPGAPQDVTAVADYAIDDVSCVPPLEPSGARPRPEHSVPIALHAAGSTGLSGVLAADAFLPADHFGLGQCTWSLQWATLRFRSPSTHFVAAISAEQIAAQRPVTLHFLAADFRSKPEALHVVIGEPVDIFSADAGPRFRVVLTGKAVSR